MRTHFRRRHYRRPTELWADLRRIAGLRGPGHISQPLRERLMLAVTAVNRCRYCASFHSQVALRSGLTATEIQALLGGATADAPPAELPALSFARHWAEQAGRPEAAARAELAAIYGPTQAQAIERAIATIWVGNLLGNSWDALLHLLSGGRLGGDRPREV